MILEDSLLSELINCKKIIEWVEPRQEKSQYNHKQQIIKVSWWWYSFEIFTRRNEDLPMNFSVWLIRKWPEQNVILCRYNWNHWEHRNPDWIIIHWCHKHQYNLASKEQWFADDAFAESTNQYETLEQALFQLMKDYNIYDENWKLENIPQRWNLFDIE